ncbi:transglutaminase family protein [Synechococcus sp. KORDI-52]|uniref:transglutaminase-like domain-containing protein n=1 Tax=Synechococcus sp. KORDI-52 TaxID=585425 RepID=UPI0012EB9767|nr:transglutaminase-like domain-containing protein [Synechococcus sp. KORDI-52]
MVDPSAIRAVPWDGFALPTAPDQRVTSDGELLVGPSARQRRSFRLESSADEAAWQQRPPVLREREALPASSPRLNAMAQQLRLLPTGRERLEAVEAWFRSQPFRYSLQPGAVADLDAFLFDQQVGFCGHYASAVAALMRAADVPSRVISGYQGGRVVKPLSGSPFLELRQSDAHAWVEVWLEGDGWQRVDASLWAASTGSQAGAVPGPPTQRQEGQVLWWRWLQWQWWGLDLIWTRWWLSFDQANQLVWLQMLFGAQLRWLGVAIVGGGMVAVAAGWLLLRVGLRPRSPLAQSLRLLALWGVRPLPGESFPGLCRRAARKHPDQAMVFEAMADQQQRLAHACLSTSQRRQHLRRWRQLRAELGRQRWRSG